MIVSTYIAYLFISIAMTIWVARTLSKNGRVFLVDSFVGNEVLADSVNHLLVVGFYLINMGFILLSLKSQNNIEDLRACIEFLSVQVGFVLLVLGALHFTNVMVIAKWRYSVIKNK
ncbi:MAG: hypothetical protein HRU38_10615 [Saccharospirillaceae bacterium]|nr:hypothetical protein [Pseudomonadales bacterium]NRB79106.1 hypothetical protein [Saccharospirillaceae bacterium]